MAKKFGGFLLLGIAAGAAAAGVYHYLQTKDRQFADVDDFEDLDNCDDVKKSRSYVDLDSAKEFMSGALDKAKDAAVKAKDVALEVGKEVSKKIQEAVADKPAEEEGDVEVVKDEESAGEKADEESSDPDKVEEAADTSESFFDDDNG
ncbi:MAG: hypothetical protein IKI75_09330 [Lachnospiraceae bacterium]|nr:hypothetical protein [Lachnospiraceae bacterium]